MELMEDWLLTRGCGARTAHGRSHEGLSGCKAPFSLYRGWAVSPGFWFAYVFFDGSFVT